MIEQVPGNEPDFSQDPTSSGADSSQSDNLTSEQRDVLDLNSVERFKFEGKEWTPQEMRNAYLMQSDYTKKTQAVAEERRKLEEFSRHWEVDQKALMQNPDLLDEFKAKYPKHFHALGENLVRYARQLKTSESSPSEKKPDERPDWAKSLEERLSQFEKDKYEAQVEKYSAQLDSTLSKMSQKYPFADTEVALVRAQSLHDRGTNLSDATWEEIFKSLHSQAENRMKEYQSKLVKEQKAANSKARDVASGGGIAGAAPDLPRTIKEATKRALAGSA